MRTYNFIGYITAESKLTVTRPNDTFSSATGTAKMQRLPRMGSKTDQTQVFFPGSSLRGALRRSTCDVVRRAVIKKSGDLKPFTLDTHYMLTQGIDVTNLVVAEKSAGMIGAEEALRTRNPFLSLFGRWKLSGHLGMGDAIPEENDVVYVDGKGARCNDFIRSPANISYLKPDDVARLKLMVSEDSTASISLGEVEQEIKELLAELKATKDTDVKNELKEKVAKLKEEKKKIKSSKSGSKEAIQRPLDGYEVIRPGTRMQHKMLLQNVTDIELGLFLAGLREFAREPFVGGHRGQGAGCISAIWEVKTWPIGADAPCTIGVVKMLPDGFVIQDEDESNTLTNAWAAWTDAAVNADFDFSKYLMVDVTDTAENAASNSFNESEDEEILEEDMEETA